MASARKLARPTCRAVLFNVKKIPKHRRKNGRKYNIKLYFVQQETDGHQGFSFPGGGRKKNETPLACVRRATKAEGIDLSGLKPITKPIIFTPEQKERLGFPSDHNTYYFCFVKADFDEVKVEHPEGDVHYAVQIDFTNLPLGGNPGEYPMLSRKQQTALRHILTDFDVKLALNRRHVSDEDIDTMLRQLDHSLFGVKRKREERNKTQR